jgi:hypothetical protein
MHPEEQLDRGRRSLGMRETSEQLAWLPTGKGASAVQKISLFIRGADGILFS